MSNFSLLLLKHLRCHLSFSCAKYSASFLAAEAAVRLVPNWLFFTLLDSSRAQDYNLSHHPDSGFINLPLRELGRGSSFTNLILPPHLNWRHCDLPRRRRDGNKIIILMTDRTASRNHIQYSLSQEIYTAAQFFHLLNEREARGFSPRQSPPPFAFQSVFALVLK
jgi:hypothetical protein